MPWNRSEWCMKIQTFSVKIDENMKIRYFGADFKKMPISRFSGSTEWYL